MMDEANAEVVALANELARAVEIIMTPNVEHTSRMEAYVACERFKEVSPLCAQVGLYLTSKPYPLTVKHFGLQLMEHTVKFKWNHISQNEKIFIKENTMKLLNQSVGPAEDPTLSHIKDALSRVIVEMIKREWPQQWGTLLSELSDACTKGEAQTELVMLVFLRLIEDVALLQTLESNQRRKDIYQALTQNMTEIFEFFLRLIELHFNGFRTTTQIGDQGKAGAHSRVVQIVLQTLTGFSEWVAIQHIMTSDGKLLQILCILLNDGAFRMSAAECLMQIVNRKGQLKDRKPLMILFGEDAMGYIYRAANLYQSQSSMVENFETIEKHYQFLKKLVLVLNGMTQQLTSLWGKEDDLMIMKSPKYFATFLSTLLAFFQHPSLTLSHSASLIWITLLKHDQISKDPLIVEYIPKVIECVGPKIYKITYPQNRSVKTALDSRVFAGIDYDSEEEFIIFFQRCRTDLLEIFRQSTLISPLVTFSYCEHWLNLRLQKAAVEVNTSCSVQDTIYLEWEAIVTVLDSVLSRILLVNERPSVATGLRLLEGCIKIETHDPLILSIVLSCISALFVFLSMSSCQITAGNCVAMTGVNLLPKVLEKIFYSLIYIDPVKSNTKNDPLYSKLVRNLRQHSTSLMVKLAHKYPLLLLPLFDQINTTIQDLIKRPEQLSKMEQIALLEALILISNHFCDYERQNSFIGDIVRPGQNCWMELSAILKTPEDFIAFVGLNQSPPQQPTSEYDPTNVYGQNRGRLVYALSSVLGIIKRCSWPDDPDRASRGGFVVAFTESGNPICRNPATTHIVPVLPHILSLCKVLNQIFAPAAVSRCAEGYRNAFQMVEAEKKTLMGVCVIWTDPMDISQAKIGTAIDKMQKFVTLIFENCYHLMGSAGPSLGRDLYSLPGIAGALIDSVFDGLEHVPDYRLRTINRVFLKPFVYSCPPAYYELVLLPIFAHLGPIMFTRLSQRWEYLTLHYESESYAENSSNADEVLADMLIRAMTREYLDVLKVALVGGTMTSVVAGDHSNDIMIDQDDHSMDGPTPALSRAAQSALASEIISELGGRLLRCSYTCNSIVMTVLNVLSWNDSQSSLRSTYLIGPIVKFLANEQLLTPHLSTNILIAVLKGLQLHGQHEANQASLITLGVQVYEIVRPKYPTVIEIMQQIPNINAADLQKLDEKLSASNSTTKGNKIDKIKKDLFKKITGQLIGKGIGQLFSQSIHIENLPPMRSSRSRTNFSDLTTSPEDSGLSQLFTTTRS